MKLVSDAFFGKRSLAREAHSAFAGAATSPANAPFWQSGPVTPPAYTLTRASTAWRPINGTLSQVSINVQRSVAGGLLFEPWGATNLVPQPRNLTHASWTRSNVIAVATAGADGVANSGTRLTTTAHGGYAQVSISSAALAHVGSLWLRRVTGTDDWWLSLDGGATRWGLTPYLVDGQWGRAIMPAQFGSDPTLRLWCTSAGNTIDVDFVQVEAGFRATSECVGTRAPESIQFTGGPLVNAAALAGTALELTAHNRIAPPLIALPNVTITWLAGQGPYGAEQYWPELQMVFS